MKTIITLLLFVTTLTTAYGSDPAIGKITEIGGQYTNPASIYFGLDVAPTNRPACSNHSTYYYVFDPATDKGKALYSLILTAKSLNKTVAINGIGSCMFNQPMEGVNYWILKD